MTTDSTAIDQVPGTTGDVDPDGGDSRVPAPAVDAVVAVLGAHVLELSVRARVAPSHVRVSAGDVSVEMGWTSTGPGYAEAPIAPARTRWAAPSAPMAPAAPAAVSAPAAVASAPAAAAAAQPSEPAAPEEAGTFPLGSPSVGMFYRAPEPGKPPFVAEGDTVRAGQQVAIVEAMKLMIPIEAERAGRVVRILVEDATAIEHGQPLFLLAPLDQAPNGSR
ncbi:biotin carboxyl carrier protein [Frankia torreyi]|uniref:Biotin carboxyl carrier protein of acetyl-CoA carboxylase n=1 Tax=Frankia torreyi TaxID=1856 RepID=A0A0D8BCL6_9ACTN|nr:MULTISPECIES: acetyl-CoA carboxylase biotin carboxyl carrier protein subunit [Frankia]KJE21921.1 biotin carboxyl carrier protein [Frankia torreyi]KQC35155.1 carboxylesterase [Frankia sp. ACN1ag]KQM05298.1 biotin carboxyl carrier protein [Frankia sp. CpI1-P]